MTKIATLLLALIGTPLFIIISALALLSFHSVDIDPSVVIIEMTRLAETPLLVSLQLFIFAGSDTIHHPRPSAPCNHIHPHPSEVSL